MKTCHYCTSKFAYAIVIEYKSGGFPITTVRLTQKVCYDCMLAHESEVAEARRINIADKESHVDQAQ